MQDHHIAIPNENHLKRIIFAELDTGGKIIQCPNCDVPFKPHLGNWIAENFPCGSCNANLSFRNSKAKTTRCPCCNFFRPLPYELTTLACGGCPVKVIHQKRDKVVKCFECKHINIPTVGRTYGVPTPNHNPPQVNRVGPPIIDQEPPQVNQADPLQGHRDFAQLYRRLITGKIKKVPPHVNRGGPHLVDQDPSQLYQAVPQQVNHRRNRAATAETESTASSPFTPRTEIVVVEYPDATVAEAVRNVATKREVEAEEDKTEAPGSKKIRR